ncbi:MAG: hemerythrin domain-containing protein [Sphingomonadales bacterium]|nr:hemerythrin domain-containing protein [Sphingomonadales bacterium]
MSFFDRIAAAVMPPESASDRANARKVAESLSAAGDWLSTVLQHHAHIETLFGEALDYPDAERRLVALKNLAITLTAHANAEESVIYPALTEIGEKADAMMAYNEQAMVKIEMGLLEKLDPMSEDWRDKLTHIRDAVAHHVCEEEGKWFPELQQHLSPADRARLNARFPQEFDRYAGPGHEWLPVT